MSDSSRESQTGVAMSSRKIKELQAEIEELKRRPTTIVISQQPEEMVPVSVISPGDDGYPCFPTVMMPKRIALWRPRAWNGYRSGSR